MGGREDKRRGRKNKKKKRGDDKSGGNEKQEKQITNAKQSPWTLNELINHTSTTKYLFHLINCNLKKKKKISNVVGNW